MDDRETILQLFLSRINKYKNKYNYLNDNDINFEEIIKKAVYIYFKESNIDNNNYEKKINIIINKLINSRINELLSSKFLEITISFINKNISIDENSTYEEVKNELDKLKQFYYNVSFFDNLMPDNFIEIINNSNIINKMLEKIYLYNKNVIDNGKFRNLDIDEFIFNMLEAYCMVNNIDTNNQNIIDTEIVDIPIDDRYFIKEIIRIPLLSIDEEKELAYRIKYNHDEKAKEELVYHNLRLVLSYALKVSRIKPGLDVKDIFQEGSIGLMRAASKFDVNKGYKFSTYSSCLIHQAIDRYINNFERTIRIPIHALEEFKKFNKLILNYEQKNGVKLSIEEAAKKFNFDAKKMVYYSEIVNGPVSLDVEIDDDNSKTNLLNFVEDTNASIEKKVVDDFSYKDIIKLFRLAKLNEKEKKVILYRFGFIDGKIYTLEAVGKKYGLTRERIRQIEKTALRKLNKVFNREYSLNDSTINISNKISNTINTDNKMNKTIFVLFEISPENFKKIYQRLSIQDKEDINKYFDESYILKIDLDEIYGDIGFMLLKERIKNILQEFLEELEKENELKKENEDIYKGLPFAKYILDLNCREQVILALQYGYYNSKYSISEVAYMLNMDKNSVISITKTLLTTFKNNINRYCNIEFTGNEYTELYNNVNNNIYKLVK